MHRLFAKYLLSASFALGFLAAGAIVNYYHAWVQTSSLLGSLLALAFVLWLYIKIEQTSMAPGRDIFSPPNITQISQEGNHLLDSAANYIQLREQAVLILKNPLAKDFEQQRGALSFHCRNECNQLLQWWIEPLDRYKHFVTPAQSRLANSICCSWVQLLALLDLPSNQITLPDMEDLLPLTMLVAKEIEQMLHWPEIGNIDRHVEQSNEDNA